MSSSEQRFAGEKSLTSNNVYVSLTYEPLDAKVQMDRVRSPAAGAIVLFAGTTRSTFASKAVTHLVYSTYTPLALRTLQSIGQNLLQSDTDLRLSRQQTHSGLHSIAITHRLGQVDVGEESILIAVSAAHRKEAWTAAEECLEEVKKKVEIWKEEWFEDGGVWRSNRDGAEGFPVNVGKGKGIERVGTGQSSGERSQRSGSMSKVRSNESGRSGNGGDKRRKDSEGFFMEGGLEL